MPRLVSCTLPSPIGTITLIAHDGGLIGAFLPDHGGARAPEACADPSHPVLVLAARELAEYFAGRRRTFTTPLAAEGTEFQRAVWRELAQIPFGERRSYGQIAQAIGRPKAVRAVGAANGANPVSILVPCHRVVGASGALTGYAGGLDAKRWLLAHEDSNRTA